MAMMRSEAIKLMSWVWFFLCLLVLVGMNSRNYVEAVNPNYRDALAKSILFFQGQRSGRLPRDQQITWRSNSGLYDGRVAHVRIYAHTHNIVSLFYSSF